MDACIIINFSSNTGEIIYVLSSWHGYQSG